MLIATRGGRHFAEGKALCPSRAAWSPDGQRLLLLDTANAALLVAGPTSLSGPGG